MQPRRRRRFVAFALACAACSIAPLSASELTVSAAASLANAFADLGKTFEAAHPGDKVVLNLAASDVLLKQIEQGAPADVFASADEMTMDRADTAKAIDPATRKDFAGNMLVVIVATGTKAPAALRELNDAAYARVAIGNPDSVPAGRYAKQALVEANLWEVLQPRLVPTQNVRQALDYVARGEAQAGFVYATDAAVLKDKVSVALTVPTPTPVRYPIAVTAASAHAGLARQFVEFITSPDAQAVLGRHGFTSVAP
jgi:molybdate transport system substrate-binding protein